MNQLQMLCIKQSDYTKYNTHIPATSIATFLDLSGIERRLGLPTARLVLSDLAAA